MTIKITELLNLLTYAGELEISILVKKDEDGDYVVKFYERFINNFDETLVIYGGDTSLPGDSSQKWDYAKNATCSCEYLMDTFVGMLKQKEEEKLKAQKRQELIELYRLTDEELEILGVVK